MTIREKRQLDYSCGAVKLFRDDLDRIFQIISETCKRTELKSGEYEYDSLDELEGHAGKEIRDLEIRGYEPALFIKTGRPLVTHLWTPDPRTAEAAFLRIKEILIQRQRLGKFPKVNFWYVLLYVFATAYFVLMIFAGLPFVWYLVGFAAIVLPGTISVITHQTGYLSSITLSRRHERKSFWSRNKDTIIVGTICALVGALATWALIKVLGE